MATQPAAALQNEARQAQIEEERQRRIAEHKRAIAADGLANLTLAERAGRGPLNIFAEGDSWFDYPLSQDTINWIGSGGNPRPYILNLAHHGDAATEVLGVSRRKRIIQNLSDGENGAFDAMLFSAGGNDLAGDQFCLWLKNHVAGAKPAQGVDRQRLANIVGVVKAAYVDLIEICAKTSPGCVLFVHAYDFAQPTNKGVCGLGPWLAPSLDLRGWTQFPQAAEVVKEVLLEFDKLLAELEAQHRNVVYVRTQRTLAPDSEWANELHPKEPGFRKIAGVFLEALRTKFRNRI